MLVPSQVRTDFRETMKRLLPNSKDFKTVMAEYTKYSNREGVFGDPDIMSLTQEDSKHVVPTYQWWHDQGKTIFLLKTALLSGFQI